MLQVQYAILSGFMRERNQTHDTGGLNEQNLYSQQEQKPEQRVQAQKGDRDNEPTKSSEHTRLQ